MAMSDQLQGNDYRAVFRLLNECAESWADPIGWRQQLCAGAIRLTGADSAAYVTMTLTPAATGSRDVPLGVIVGVDAAAEKLFSKSLGLAGQGAVLVPGMPTLLGHAIRDRQVVLPRERFVDDRSWYDSQWYQEHRKPCGVDHTIHACSILSNGKFSGLTIDNVVQGRRFKERQRAVLELLYTELVALIGEKLATEAHFSALDLSPRCRETLELLVEGGSEKQIAEQLSLGRPTVHQYIGMIYRHFDVRSRAELMAYFVRRKPRLKRPTRQA